MSSFTERLKLILTPASEITKNFLTWRTEMSGDVDSNMIKIDSAIADLQDNKQDTISGKEGQVVGFNEEGYMVAQEAPDTGVVSFNGRNGVVVPTDGDYTAAMVGALPNNTFIPKRVSELANDIEYATIHDVGVGKNVEGQLFWVDGYWGVEEVQAQPGAEIFNNYTSNAAVGRYSTSEGSSTVAMGECSHAEGFETTASGDYSHAEGVGTIAVVKQHVEGQFNIEDDDELYLHIVGNGDDTLNRSNAYVLDRHGNAWFSGDVYVGSESGKEKDGGSVKLQREIRGETGDFLVIGNDGLVTTRSIMNFEEASF